MKKTQRPLIEGIGLPIYPKLSLTFFFFLFCINFDQVFAQCNLTVACVHIQVSLNQECMADIEVDMILEGNLPAQCENDVMIELFEQNGDTIPTSPVITGDYINETVVGRITQISTGIYCQGNILVEDKLAPVIICQDTSITCFDDPSPEFTGEIFAKDNCSDSLIINYVDAVSNQGCHVSDTISTIERTWTAEDLEGKSSDCIQTIYVIRPPLDSIDFPINLDDISAPPLYCPNPDTSPENTGFPNYKDTSVDSVCSFLASYTETTFPICEGSYKLFREWTVFDGCTGQSIEETQTIKVLDTLPPDIVCPANMVVNTSNLDCNATILLPQPSTIDSCGTTLEITVELDEPGVIISGLTIYNLASGDYEAMCLATDDCGNTATCTFDISVVDEVPPVAISLNNPNITLLPQEPTYVPASAFDDGSFDNCSDVTLEVRRMDSPYCDGDDSTPFDTHIPFYCCDIGNTIPIELRTTDEAGNSSISQTNADVFDNLNPGIICPTPVTIDCTDDYENMNLTGGEALATDNCPGFIIEHTDSLDLGSCGQGAVYRTWSVEDIVGRRAECVQVISIENMNPFYVNENDVNDPNDDIVWPENYTGTSCGDGLNPDDLPAENGYPEIMTGATCNLVAVSYSDTWLLNSPNVCVEVIRKWFVIDWCNFNQQTFEGSWEYGQILSINDMVPPTILKEFSNIDTCNAEGNCDEITLEFELEAFDSCTDQSLLTYEFDIDFGNDNQFEKSGTGQLISETFPIGTHRIYYKVQDHCANNSTRSFTVNVNEECKKPTVYCTDTLITVIMPTAVPMIEVNADIFNFSSSDNCTADSNLIYSFSSDITDTIRLFTCDEVGVNGLKMWVTDEAGNQDYCSVGLKIQSNDSCNPNALISGTVATESGNEIGEVMVKINGQITADSMTTDDAGEYVFFDVPTGGDYTITPQKDINISNGVTTFDLVLISKHILGTQPLNSPYKLIAADVNQSGAVTTFDLVAIRKVILAISDEFPNNTSWRFIDGEFQFSDPQKPFDDNFPEAVSINNLSGDETVDFIGIKIGDVNGSANAGELLLADDK